MDLYTAIMICSMFHNNAITNAIIQNGSHENPLAVTVISQPGQPGAPQTDFKTVQEAASYTKQQLAAGNHVEIGMMQIPSNWLPLLDQQGVSIDDLFRSCKNIAVATDLLNQSEAYCTTLTDTNAEAHQCALSFYKTGDAKQGLDYAKQILAYAKNNPLQANPTNQKIDYNDYLKFAGLALPPPSFSNEVNDNASDTQ